MYDLPVFFQHMFYSTRLHSTQVKENKVEKGTINLAYSQNGIIENITQMHLNSFQLGATVNLCCVASRCIV